MLYQIVAIYDKKAEIYGLPNFFSAIGIANRGFVDEINRPDANNTLYRHPDDFVLYHMGTYDDQKPAIVMFEHPRELARGNEVAVRENGTQPNLPGVLQ